jgi:glycine/D-amino acid oxidase-like deaminating enzyme
MTDLLVVGAGVMGAWTAYWAARVGVDTRLVDAFGPGDPRATSGDESRIIRSSHGPDEFYARWAREARELWIELSAEWGEELFLQSGMLWLSNREDGNEAAAERTLRRLAIPVERVTPDEIRVRWPQIDPTGLAFGLFEPEAGILRARHSIRTVVSAFERAGGQFDRSVVLPGRADGDRLVDVIDGNGRRHTAEQFVFACGPWLPRLFPEELGNFIKVTKQDVFYLGAPAGDTSYGPDRLPPFVEYGLAFYGMPALDGRGIKLAPDRTGPAFDPSAGERIVDPDSLRLMRAYARRRLPGLATVPVIETRVCQYESTSDAHFLIDRHPRWSNVWLVGGGSGHGFKHGPKLGQYVVSRVGGAPAGPGEERFALERQAGDRLGLRAGGDTPSMDWQGY